MLLARTDPDRSKTHRGLSLFTFLSLAEGHSFERKTAAEAWKPGDTDA